MRPVVIDPLHAPGLDNASPYLVIFAACVGGLDLETEGGARQVLTAIRATRASDADRKQLTTIILKSASDAARQILRDMMTMTEWKSDFIESYVTVGLEQAKAEYVLKTLDKRGLDLTMEQRHHVSACTDLAQLDQWFDRALTATTAANPTPNRPTVPSVVSASRLLEARNVDSAATPAASSGAPVLAATRVPPRSVSRSRPGTPPRTAASAAFWASSTTTRSRYPPSA